MKKAAKRVSPGKKAAATKKRRAAAQKAVTTRTRRAAGKKAAATKSKQRSETVQLAEAALAGFDAGDLTTVRINLKHLVELLTEPRRR
jgi:hypothetical protein